jgi:predicted methyltransferase
LCLLALHTFVFAAGGAVAQNRGSEEAQREGWQKVDAIFSAMGIRPGAIVADVGAGEGFFTTRLARAVGPEGRVYAVDINKGSLDKLRRRLAEGSIENVTVIESEPDDPKLPEQTLDAALIINAYHEMRQHQAILTKLTRALKPAGRLVIVEPIMPSRRGKSRAEQARQHEIDPEYVMQDARAAGFRIVHLEDPFTSRNEDIEWLITLQPAEAGPAPTAAAPQGQEQEKAARPEDDQALRISIDDFRKLSAAGAVTIVDVRGDDSFEAGHIPGAVSIPLAEIASAAERLRRLGKPIVTYCS